MIQDELEPSSPGGDGPDRVTIPSRPIESGVYSWGWVDYGDYGPDGRPESISVVMFSDPSDRNTMASIRKVLSRPGWLTVLTIYGPLFVAYLAMSFGDIAEHGWLVQLALGLTLFSGWRLWGHCRNLRLLSQATVLWGDRGLENYAAGRAFLRALNRPALARDDLFAYFDLRVHSDELKKLLSDTSY